MSVAWGPGLDQALAQRKQAVLEELEREGLPLDPILDELGKDLDPFDLICHVAFDANPRDRGVAGRPQPRARV